MNMPPPPPIIDLATVLAGKLNQKTKTIHIGLLLLVQRCSVYIGLSSKGHSPSKKTISDRLIWMFIKDLHPLFVVDETVDTLDS